MWIDKALVFLYSPITWGIGTLILAAIALSGRLSMTASNILLIFALAIGCLGIFRSGLGVHLSIIFCLVLGIGLTLISWWIQPSSPQPKQPTAEEIATEVAKRIPSQSVIPLQEKEELQKEPSSKQSLDPKTEGKLEQSHIGLAIQIMAGPSYEHPLQGHHIFITNHSSQPFFDCRIEIIFKDTITKVEAWPVLKNMPPGKVEFHGKKKDGSPLIYKEQIPMPNECSLDIHQAEVNNQIVNTNVLIFSCQRWPRNIFAFSADIQTDSSKVGYPKRGPEETYHGIYFYEVSGQTLSGTINGKFTKSNEKTANE